MTMLLHICCGPCATATIDHWRAEVGSVGGFFYNPNIHPLLEFRRRLTGARDLAAEKGLQLDEDTFYDPRWWFVQAGTKGEERCRACIGLRLDRTGRQAAERGFSTFSTTLAISPWQDHDAIREAGAEAAGAHGIEFVYEDLRGLYRTSRSMARHAGLYRQKYCGCVLSEWERYR